MSIQALSNGISNAINAAEDYIQDHTAAAVVGAAGAAAVGGVVAGSLLGSSSSKTTKRKGRTSHTKRGWKQDRKRFNKSQKWEVAYRKRKAKAKKGRRKAKGSGRVHYSSKLKRHYIILSSGKWKFVKGRK